MKIYVKPTCIIERALWNKFSVHVLPKIIGKKQKVDDFIAENLEFEINENDALVIGLLKCIETDNLSHRLNNMIADLLSNRSIDLDIDENNHYMIRKKLVITKILDFKNNFPKEWKPDGAYRHGLKELFTYIDYLLEKIETLKIHTVEDKGMMIEYLYYNNVKKLMKIYN